MDTLIILSGALGALSHILFFNREEHHLYGASYVFVFFMSLATLLCAPNSGVNAIPFSTSQVLLVAGCYLCGLYTSLLVYRILLHPLNKFPGPFGARLSSLWFSSQLSKSDARYRIRALHQKYGDFVRIGSSDLSITHPEGVTAVYGPSSKCVKGSWYDLTHPMVSLQTTRDKTLHQQRRRTWSEAFSDKALRGYEERMKKYRAKLINHISESISQGKPVDVTEWFHFYTFDVMGDLAFGSSFEMLDTGVQHWSIPILDAGKEPLGRWFPMWFFRLVMAIPGLSKDWLRYMGYFCEKVNERAKVEAGIPDIMSALLKPWKDKRIPVKDLEGLQADGQLIIVAGSDTSSAAYTHILYELVKHPSHVQKLREELAAYTVESRVDYGKIQSLPHLNGVINETLRLHSASPTILPRITPPEGIYVGDAHVPGNMTVWCSQYPIGRSESIYPDATSFIPERWSSRPDLITDKSAFAPFSSGAYACIGKSLALQDIRNTVAELITRFDIKTSEFDDLSSFEENTKDQFVLRMPKLRLSFSNRRL